MTIDPPAPNEPTPFEGQIGAPEVDAYPGKGIHLRHSRLRIQAEAGFRSMNLHQTDGIILALDWVTADFHHVWGSAVLVAPGVALTARHTIDAMREAGFLAEDGGILLAYGFHPQGMMIWNAVHVEQDPSGDLAVLTLVRATATPQWALDVPLPVHAASIAARMPRQGEILTLIGFKADKPAFKSSGADMMPKPSAYIDAPTLGGMSGGAALDSEGHLVGIISKGMSAEGDDGPSFILLTWPILFTEFEVVWPLGLSASPTSLHAMAGVGLASIEGIENLIPGRDANGTLTVTLITHQDLG
jgi:hypothetical protein